MPERDAAPRRLRRAEAVLARRTGRLLLVLERCSDEHNRLAVLRPAEALGVQRVALVEGVGRASEAMSKGVTRGAAQWLDLRRFRDPSACVATLKEEGWTIWATDLSPSAESAEPSSLAPLPAKLALIFGRETDGVSEEALAAADRRLYLPTVGFMESLNLSVAAALLLQRLFDACPEMRGDLSASERAVIRARWYRRLAGGKQPARFDGWLVNPPPPLEELRLPPELRMPRLKTRAQRALGMRPAQRLQNPGSPLA